MSKLSFYIILIAYLILVSSYSLNKIKSCIVKPNFKLASSSENDLEKNGIENVTPEIIETPEEKYRREKIAEIAEKKAAEVFVTRNTGRYECQACGYIYSESDGLAKRGIAPGTPFESIEKFRCPQCGVDKKYFVPETETLSGFKENLKYGLGGNSLTSGQKSNLIFGGLFIAFAVFMSGYLLE
jgi:rubredoxin